jgi:hypothetical protein
MSAKREKVFLGPALIFLGEVLTLLRLAWMFPGLVLISLRPVLRYYDEP